MPQELKPELRFPEFDGDWTEVLLSELMTFKNGVNAGKEDYGSGYKFINVLDIIENQFITYDSVRGSVNISEEEFNKNIVEYGDILFQRSSETREEVGQANVYLDKQEPVTFGGFVIRGKKISDYNPIFLKYLLETSKARKEVVTKSGGSTRYNVGQSSLSEVRIFITEEPEQQKIANFLKAIDKRIKLLKAKKDALEDYKTSVMQKLFAQEIRFKQDDGSDFPEWEEKKLSMLFNGKKGKGLPKSSVAEQGEYPCVLYGELYTKYDEVIERVISYTDSEHGVKSHKGDLLMPTSTTTTGIDLANVTALNIEDVRLGGDISILRKKVELNTIFYAYYLSNYKKNELAKYAQGITIVHLYFSHLKNIKVDFPHVDEQNKIAEFLLKLERKKLKIDDFINDLGMFKKAMLQKMFV